MRKWQEIEVKRKNNIFSSCIYFRESKKKQFDVKISRMNRRCIDCWVFIQDNVNKSWRWKCKRNANNCKEYWFEFSSIIWVSALDVTIQYCWPTFFVSSEWASKRKDMKCTIYESKWQTLYTYWTTPRVTVSFANWLNSSKVEVAFASWWQISNLVVPLFLFVFYIPFAFETVQNMNIYY